MADICLTKLVAKQSLLAEATPKDEQSPDATDDAQI